MQTTNNPDNSRDNAIYNSGNPVFCEVNIHYVRRLVKIVAISLYV